MEISGVAQSLGSSATSSATNTSNNQNGIMDKDDFLKLFLASLQYQDPMSPMESKDMMAQMSQLSMVEQITNLGKVVESLKTMMQTNPLEKGVSYLGLDVSGVTSDGESVQGKVNEVAVKNDVLELMVNGKALEIGNLTKVAYPGVYDTYNS
jgi:flagellar basal-body rod modification protein FlgD